MFLLSNWGLYNSKEKDGEKKKRLIQSDKAMVITNQYVNLPPQSFSYWNQVTCAHAKMKIFFLTMATSDKHLTLFGV